MSCSSAKRAYPTPSAALVAVQKRRARLRKRGAKHQQHGSVGVSVYRCPACGAWHLGRSARKRRTT